MQQIALDVKVAWFSKFCFVLEHFKSFDNFKSFPQSFICVFVNYFPCIWQVWKDIHKGGLSIIKGEPLNCISIRDHPSIWRKKLTKNSKFYFNRKKLKNQKSCESLFTFYKNCVCPLLCVLTTASVLKLGPRNFACSPYSRERWF